MEISIIINNYKTRGFLKSCLKGILSHPPSVPYEIIVVDNNSGDGSVELMREKFPDIKLIASDKNLGHQKGNNLGIKNSSGKYVVIVNTDIVLFDDVFDRLYKFMEEHPDAALVGPKLKNPDGTVQSSCLGFPRKMTPLYRRTFMRFLPAAKKELRRYLMTDFDHSATRQVDWIFGAFEMVRRGAIDRVGLMDEYFFLYFGDTAWCRKFWDNGLITYYFADANVVHFHRRESADGGMFSKAFWIHTYEWIKYLIKYGKYDNTHS